MTTTVDKWGGATGLGEGFVVTCSECPRTSQNPWLILGQTREYAQSSANRHERRFHMDPLACRQCRHCGRIFDLRRDQDSEDWFTGHPCTDQAAADCETFDRSSPFSYHD